MAVEYGLNLWDYWRIVYKRKWIIISIFLVSVVSSHFFAERAIPMYRSSVTLNMGTGRTPIAEVTGAGVTFWGGVGGDQISTQMELIRSYSILRGAALQLGYITPETGIEKVQAVTASLRGKISVEEKGDTNLIVISTVDTKPVRAKDITETVADVFMQRNWEKKVEEARNTKKFVEKQLEKLNNSIVDIKRKLRYFGTGDKEIRMISSDMDEFSTRMVKLKFELSSLRERYTDNYPRIKSILAEIDSISKKMGTTPRELEEESEMELIDADRLRSELEINTKLYGLLKERYEKARIMEASQTKDIEIVDPAFVPKAAIAGGTTANVIFGGAIGLVLGLVAALITESMDTSIGTIEDVEEYLKIPVLGVVPHIDIIKKEEVEYWKEPPPPDERKKYEEIMGRLVTQYRPKSPIAEAYRNLQTYIKFSGLDKVGNCLMFTSSGIREGKTMTTVNSALSMAQLGYKVVLVDADLRRPSVHKVFGVEREMGVTEAVLGTFKTDDVIKTIDDIMLGNLKSSIILKTYGMENL
ncbi:MAG: GNVR domain-containing protein, partial [Candidatus Omnitrophota bacterium]